MDPEVIAQLEEQLRQMTDMLVQQNKTMASQVSAINGATSSYSGFTRSLGSSSHAATKYEEAIRKASEKTTESTERWSSSLRMSKEAVGTFSQAMSGATTLVGTFAGALLSTEKGFSKYGATVGAASDSVTKLTSAIPLFGTALGAAADVVGKTLTALVGDGLKLLDAIVELRDETVKTAGALPVTSEGLLQLANDAKYFGQNIQVLGKITQGLGTGLATLGKTAGDGAVKFMEMANVSEETRQAFGRMGISQERLTEMQGMYIKSQEASGLSMQNQTKTTAQLRKESIAYVDNMTRLSSLTGKQAEQLQAEQDLVAATIQEKMEVVKENAEIKRLRADGRHAEADNIERQQKDRDAFRKQITADLGPEAATMAMKVIRSGVYDNVSAPLAVLGIDFVKYGEMIKSGSVDAAEAGRSLTMEYDKGVERMGTSLGKTTEFLDDSQFKNLGVVGEAVSRGLTRAGKNYEDANTQAEKIIADRKNKGSPVDNTIEQFRAVERTLQQKYQEVLMEGIKKAAAVLNQMDLTKIAAKAFDTVLGNVEKGLIGLGVVVGGISGVLAALKLGQWAANSNAEKAQKDFTKALKDSTDALRYNRDASRKAAAADSSEARASSASASADRIEARASDLAKAADSAEARASSASASADRAEAAASRRAASADMREASASQRAASADIREAAESMRAAAADLREARASDAAAAADKRESMSSGGGILGKAGRFLGRALPWAAGGMAAYDAFSGFNADPNAAFGDKIKNAGSSAINGLTFGLLGSSSLDISEKAANNLQNPQAASGSVESTNQALMEQMSILSSISTTGGVEKLTQEQLAAFGLSNEFGPVVAQEPGTSEKAAQAEQAKPSEYTIQKGDTLAQLSKIHGITLESLLGANKQITNKDLIYEGHKLALPGVVSGIPGTEVMDPEEIEQIQSDVLKRNREANEEVIQKTKVESKLLETTISYDTTLSATNDALKIFKDLIVSLNSVLGGIAAGASASGSQSRCWPCRGWRRTSQRRC